MSYCSALPVVESESNILIDACLAGVRRNVCLDDASALVLPPLHDLLPPAPPLRVVAPPMHPNRPNAERSVRPSLPTTERARTRSATGTIARSMRWPVLLCGFVGGTFAGAALMKSPVGAKPALQHLAETVTRAVR